MNIIQYIFLLVALEMNAERELLLSVIQFVKPFKIFYQSTWQMQEKYQQIS